MKLKTLLAAAVLATVAGGGAVAQTTKDGATAGEKPGQGTNTGTPKDGKMMGPPPLTDSGTSGTSTGNAGSEAPVNTQPGANGKGVTPNSNSGPAPK